MLLDGKHVVVTGGTSGIGLACVKLLSSEGADVWVLSRSESEAFSDYDNVHSSIVDLSDGNQIADFVKKLRHEANGIDALVNCAGIMDTALIQMTSEDSLRRQFETNFFGHFTLSKLISRMMMKSRSGSIVNVSSTMALECVAGKTAYAASKAALIGFSKSLAAELGPFNIRVNCIAPSIVRTPLLEGLSEDAIQESIQRSSLGRIAEPEEVAGVVLFLVSDYSSYVSGQVIKVDGGI